MQDRVADVFAQRAALDRGPVAGVALSVLLHAAIFGGAIYAAMHSPAPQPAKMVNIQFASMPAAQSQASAPKPAAATPAPAVEAPKIVEPKPVVDVPPPAPPEKNTVPTSPFGRSTKKGSDAPEKPLTSAPSLAGEPSMTPGTSATTGTAPEIAIGGSGVTGIEGGDFPHTVYLQAMHKAIGDKWSRPTVGAGATTVIYLRIARDGKITESRVATSSGDRNFDRAALSAVRSASPLQRLPPAYAGTYLGVHITFR